MKSYIYAALTVLSLIVTSCSDSNTPILINEEELITTVTVTLTPSSGGNAITLESKDLDGEGPNAPVVVISGNLQANTTYNGTIVLLNETETPVENITEEVEEEGDEHQFFYTVSGGLNIVTAYTDKDANQKPIGINFTLETTTASSGTLSIILRHEPNKIANGVADGVITNAGGETDVEVSFPLTIVEI